MIDVNISISTFNELIKEINPLGYNYAFIQATNEVTHETLDLMKTKFEEKWNLDLKETLTNKWEVHSTKDGTVNQRGGTILLEPIASHRSTGSINITFKGQPINLSRFVTQWDTGTAMFIDTRSRQHKMVVRKAEPKVKILRNGTAIQIRKSFEATMRSGHRGLFQRNRKNARSKILELRTITLPSMLLQVGFEEQFNHEFNDKFTRAFDLAHDRYKRSLS